MNGPVRISELIERLTEWHERYGDCPVYFEDLNSGWMTEVESVDFASGFGAVSLAVEMEWDE